MKVNKGHMGSTIEFISSEDKSLFQKDFNAKSQMLEIFNKCDYRGNYDTSVINFEELIVSELISKKIVSEKIFKQYDNNLENLHLCLNDDIKVIDES